MQVKGGRISTTIGWLAVAIATGSIVGLVIGHWSTVATWLHRCMEDPVGRPWDADRSTPVEAQAWRDRHTSA